MCLFCNHENAVSVKLDKKSYVGSLECKVCGQHFQCGINCKPPRAVSWLRYQREAEQAANWDRLDLSAAIDVYSEWVDAADAVAQQAMESEARTFKSAGGRAGGSSRRIDEEEDEDDRGYEGEGVVADDEEYE